MVPEANITQTNSRIHELNTLSFSTLNEAYILWIYVNILCWFLKIALYGCCMSPLQIMHSIAFASPCSSWAVSLLFLFWPLYSFSFFSFLFVLFPWVPLCFINKTFQKSGRVFEHKKGTLTAWVQKVAMSTFDFPRGEGGHWIILDNVRKSGTENILFQAGLSSEKEQLWERWDLLEGCDHSTALSFCSSVDTFRGPRVPSSVPGRDSPVSKDPDLDWVPPLCWVLPHPTESLQFLE